jgi:hypothetical protein
MKNTKTIGSNLDKEYTCPNCDGRMLLKDYAIGKHDWCKPRLEEFNRDYKVGYLDGLEKGVEIALGVSRKEHKL